MNSRDKSLRSVCHNQQHRTLPLQCGCMYDLRVHIRCGCLSGACMHTPFPNIAQGRERRNSQRAESKCQNNQNQKQGRNGGFVVLCWNMASVLDCINCLTEVDQMLKRCGFVSGWCSVNIYACMQATVEQKKELTKQIAKRQKRFQSVFALLSQCRPCDCIAAVLRNSHERLPRHDGLGDCMSTRMFAHTQASSKSAALDEQESSLTQQLTELRDKGLRLRVDTNR